MADDGFTVTNYLPLGVRSLANASRARQFNPLNTGVGWVPLPQTNMAAVVVRAQSCVRGRACVVVRAQSCVRGRACAVVRAWSCVRGRSCVVVHGRSCTCVRGRSFVVVRGRSCAVVPFCPLRGQHCRDTNERTTSNNQLNPPGVGWINFF